MLRLICWWTAILILSFAVLGAAAVVFGDGSPTPVDPRWRDLFGFAACDLPCWAGITPGETAFEDALDLLARHIPALEDRTLISGSQINFWATDESRERELSGLILYNRGRAGDVQLTTTLPVAYLVEWLGMPDCVWATEPSLLTGDTFITIVYWQRGGVTIAANRVGDFHALLEPTTGQRDVWLIARPDVCEGAVGWLGFAPPWYYARESASLARLRAG